MTDLMTRPIVEPETLPDAEILARTLYGEARGEDLAGIEAVASVILNRVAFARRVLRRTPDRTQRSTLMYTQKTRDAVWVAVSS